MYAVTLDPAERATFSNKLVRNVVKGGDEGTAFQTHKQDANSRIEQQDPVLFLSSRSRFGRLKRGRRKATPHAIWAANSVSKKAPLAPGAKQVSQRETFKRSPSLVR
jgi:hypothetical protein